MQTRRSAREPTLADRVRSGGAPADAATDLVAALQDVEQALCSVIGPRGVAALCGRALFLASAEHGWLNDVRMGPDSTGDHAALRAAVASQDQAGAASGAQAILAAFQGLLQTMVGASLADRLLQYPLTNVCPRAPAQDRRP
jgi:hypothetical protein